MKENQHDPERKMWSVKGKQYIGQLIEYSGLFLPSLKLKAILLSGRLNRSPNSKEPKKSLKFYLAALSY